MSRIIRWLDERLYPEYGDYWDDIILVEQLTEVLDENATVLDFGAGSGGLRSLFDFRARARRVCGVDLDPVVLRNPYLHEARVMSTDGAIPFGDDSFDVVFSVNVLEHVANPERCFREIRRVLKPGGVFIAKTPNFWHYVPVIASLTPNSFHVYINRLRGRSSEHTFPTTYKCNTEFAIRRLAQDAGFKVSDINLVEGRPEYLRIVAPLYILGWLYERLVNSVSGFSKFRGVLYITLVRK